MYEAALESLAKRYPNEKETDQAWYLIAELHASKARQYQPSKDTSHRYEYLVAKRICEQVLARKDSSEGRTNCQNLLQQITAKELSLQAEKVNQPVLPFRLLVNFRNISQLHFRLIKMDRATKEKVGRNQWDEDYWKAVLSLPALKTFTQDLPATNDHQFHATEIKVDALPTGEYALLASANSKFDLSVKPMVLQYLYISNIAYINNGNDFFVLHRETGKPLANAQIQVWHPVYDYNSRKWTVSKGQALKADNNGFFRLKEQKNEQRGTLRLEVSTANDHLFLDDEAETYRYYQTEEEYAEDEKKDYEEDNTKTFLFTDRSIYRPGQVVYYKGIVVTKDFKSRQSKIVPSFKTIIFLLDANDEVVDSINVTTNEYGSYSGKFTLPLNRLNGSFYLEDEMTEARSEFSVEEYKRPKFFVEYEKPKGTYRVNDTVRITGFAKAYAGNNIDGARVSYRIVRKARFPYPWLFWRWGFPRTAPQEIIHGVAVTGADGKFSLSFNAIPDKTIKKEFDPVFDYEIIADVTDMSGETRTGSTMVSVSYKALQLFVTVPGGETMPADSLKNLTIRTTNLAGEFQPSLVNISVFRLNAPQRLIRPRYWQEPDMHIMTRAEYLQFFPYDEYSNESKKESWDRLEKVVDKNDSVRSLAGAVNRTLPININPGRFSPGWYAIEVTTRDRYGELVKDIQYVQLTDPKTNAPANPSYNWLLTSAQVKEPGQIATVNIGSSANDVFVIQQIDRKIQNVTSVRRMVAGGSGGEAGEYSFLNISNEQRSISFPVSEKDRGGFGIYYAFVKHNRFFISSANVVVPWSNKDLKVTYETFRDKTLPGSEEKWKVKLTGHQNEKASAEVLTAMYDASLDQFKPHNWSKPYVWPVHSSPNNWNGRNNFSAMVSLQKYQPYETFSSFIKEYDRLMTNIYEFRQREFRSGGIKRGEAAPGANQEVRIRGNAKEGAEAKMEDALAGQTAGLNEVVVVGYGQQKKTDATGAVSEITPTPIEDVPVQIRKNFNETAFFFPDLKTDSAGNIEFSFTMPEALTQWKWMMLSHTKELALGYSEKTIVTQKELMVQPNIPRFIREGDRMDLSAKLVNMGEKEVTGQIELQLLDATTNQSIDGWFNNMFPNQYFTAAAGQSTVINFTIQIPYQFNKPVIIRFIAKAGNVSDGEENSIPVLSNRQLVTETLPLNVRGGGSKNFSFEKLLQSDKSETLSHHALTVEFTSNPAWYAVQALPYLMEFPYECSEQIWNRVYANALASKIANASPRIKEIFSKWKTIDTAALISNLQKNQELKSVLLEETPWVLQAKNETEQKKRIAMLFDMVKLSEELDKNIDKLMQMQSPNGGFVWFKGGPDNRYITQYILTGIGHLKKLNAIPAAHQQKINAIIKLAVPYLDSRLKEDYDWLVKNKADLSKQHISYIQINYLYMRSFFTNIDAAGNISQPFNYYRKQAQQFWLQQNRYMQGMTALALYRTGDGKTATDILRSLKQNAIVNDELGMYWKDMSGGFYWHQAPIETQALLIEAFTDITKDITAADALKTWLLKNKQTNNWRTTKATAEACYALLLQGTDWLTAEPVVQIKMGDKTVSSLEQRSEAGSGYFKKVFDGPFVNNSMGNISVNITQPNKPATGKPSIQTAWGAVYWQYFENLENITPAATPLQLTKKLFIERNTDRGPVLEPAGENAMMKVGDKVKVRIELRVDRDMEYVHMKDMRASSLEPVNVISSYKWQGGLGYYETTKDASTNFFFDYLRKGTYVFEYALFVTHTGTFSNGITTIQCMYAPEFSSHSEGVKINVEN
ncbi:MAG TPA: alpha-2-macroglobulin family protein [Chitinophagaceae bacterium]